MIGQPFASILIAVACASACNNARRRQPPSPPDQLAQSAALHPVLPDTPAGQKLQEWLAAIGAADRAMLEAVHSGEGPEQMLIHVNMDMAVAKRSGGFELWAIERATPAAMTVIVRAPRLERWRRVEFRVEPEQPHTITMVRVEESDDPIDAGRAGLFSAALDSKTRNTVIDAVIEELNRGYVFPDHVSEMERVLRDKQSQHAYDRIDERSDFARVLTEDLQSISHDKHLRVRVHGSDGAPGDPGQRSHVIGETKRLDHDIAYVEIISFVMPPDLAGNEVYEAMAKAADAKALILDVRRNRGGSPETVALVSSYLFGDEPVLLNSIYWRGSGRTVESFTDPTVARKKFGATKPVYVLTSAHTFSGGEGFAYNLQALKRATIIGEATGGAAHPGGFEALPHGFDVFVPSGRPINRITRSDWEGTGVKPDVAVAEDAAFETARQLALARTRNAGRPSTRR